MRGDLRDRKTGELVYKAPEPPNESLIRALEMAIRELKSGRKVTGHRTSVTVDTVTHKALGFHIDISFAP